MQNFVKLVLFIFFFSVGAAALACSVLAQDLMRYYYYKGLLRSAQESLRQLESLNVEYDVLLENLQRDPNLLQRVAPAVIGTAPTDANAVYPRATAEQLAAAKQALAQASLSDPNEPIIPTWLGRAAEPNRRTVLFIAGAFLVVLSFICFGSGKGA